MPKRCWICKNTEDFFLEQKDALLKSIDEQIAECDKFEKQIKTVTAEKTWFY